MTQPDGEFIDNVAQAIFEGEEEELGTSVGLPWSQLDETIQTIYRRFARLAIIAAKPQIRQEVLEERKPFPGETRMQYTKRITEVDFSSQELKDKFEKVAEGLAKVDALPPSLAVVPNIPWSKQTKEQLTAERDYWQVKIDGAKGWGAGLAAANGFRNACQEELNRREEKEQKSMSSMSEGTIELERALGEAYRPKISELLAKVDRAEGGELASGYSAPYQDLLEKRERYIRAARLSAEAQGEEEKALGELNEAQKAFDNWTLETRAAAPKESMWAQPEKGAKVA